MPADSSTVFARRGRWVIVRVVQKEAVVSIELGPIRNRVLLDYRRHLADEKLKTYVDDLRDRANIKVASP